MIVVSGIDQDTKTDILRYIPYEIKNRLYNVSFDGLEEIRLRAGLPVTLAYSGKKLFLADSGGISRSPSDRFTATDESIRQACELIFHSSVYAYEDEIRRGFITLPGGHRAGISGTAVMKGGQLTFIKDISAVNYRIASDAAVPDKSLLGTVYNGGDVRSTLIIAPPRAGKTTLLRELIRYVSDKCVTVSVIDERHELAATYMGKHGFYLGAFTDILDGCPKTEGMNIALRSLSPEVIATDEISASDVPLLAEITNSGVSVFATVHAKNRAELAARPLLSEIIPFFSCFITISDKTTHIPDEVFIS